MKIFVISPANVHVDTESSLIVGDSKYIVGSRTQSFRNALLNLLELKQINVHLVEFEYGLQDAVIVQKINKFPGVTVIVRNYVHGKPLPKKVNLQTLLKLTSNMLKKVTKKSLSFFFNDLTVVSKLIKNQFVHLRVIPNVRTFVPVPVLSSSTYAVTETSFEAVDAVVLFVDSTDPVWKQKYNKYKRNAKILEADKRYRCNHEIKYCLKSLLLHAEWLRNIYVVTDCGQNPAKKYKEFLGPNANKVKIIDHNEIVPSKYLPLFNSSALEMFLHNVPGVSENFLYLNDDMVLLKPTKLETFADTKTRKLKSFVSNKNVNAKAATRVKNLKTIDIINYSNCAAASAVSGKFTLCKRTHHQPILLNKHACEFLWKNACVLPFTESTASSRFRSESVLKPNINQYFISFVARNVLKLAKPVDKTDLFCVYCESELEFVQKCTRNSQMVCVNDFENEPKFLQRFLKA